MLVLAWAFASFLQAAPPPRPEPQPGLSWAEADSLGRKLEAMEKRPRGPRPRGPETVSITEGELNSYLNLSLGARMPPGLTDVEVRLLDGGRIDAKGEVDMGQVRQRVQASAFNPITYLSGRLPVEVKGRLLTPQDGFGSLEFEEIRLGPLTLPSQMLAQWVSSFSRSPESPDGFDVQRPFRLPYGLRRGRIQTGRVFLEF